ncbi:MAG TPA: protein kinase, partial [Ktedonobacterales bacterium]|nr:protein kinase [Ktedonobacterales bacterium]
MAQSTEGKLAGRTLGHYLLLSLIGTGGMAEVYRARDIRLPREVALKVLPATLASDPAYVQRFRSEARRVAKLRHPNIVPVYEFGEQDGLLFLVMPLLDESLRERLSRHDGRLPTQEALDIAVQVAEALETAHVHGIVHRDVKPENVLLDPDGRALLTDFGIARELAFLRRPGSVQTLAATGLPVGTPEYMAPEQLRGGPVDQRADVYALGAVLYEMLTGRAPHEAATPYEVAALSLTAPIVRPSRLNPDVWPQLEAVIMRALAHDAGQRYHSLTSFIRALYALQGGAVSGTRMTIPLFDSGLADYSTGHLPTYTLAGEDTANRSSSRPKLMRKTFSKRAPRASLAITLALLLVFSGLALMRGMGALGGTLQPSVTSLATATEWPTATPYPTVTPESTATPKPTPTVRPTATPKPVGTTASFAGKDTTTLGTWRGKYGSSGYEIFEDNGSLSPGIEVGGIGEQHYVWMPSTTDKRALQRALDSAQRIAATWYTGGSDTYTIDVNITDGKQHEMALYCLDWDTNGRSQTIQILDAKTNKVLNTQSISSFHQGIYLRWKASGHIKIVLTRNPTGIYNAVASG